MKATPTQSGKRSFKVGLLLGYATVRQQTTPVGERFSIGLVGQCPRVCHGTGGYEAIILQLFTSC